jgi:DNA (cytosine-5)-methyltransferase 1
VNDRPKLLDLFSCAGLGAEGYADRFEVTGVDIDPQPHYPYEFIQADVLTLDPAWIATFDAVHASPPCQHYTELRHRYVRNDHPALIAPTRELLEAAGRPYVIENVEGARKELKGPLLLLCGLMFPDLRVFRHRLFETSFDLTMPMHPLHGETVCHTLDKRKRQYGHTDEMQDFVTVTGGGNCTKAAAADAMGVAHRTELTKQELNEGIPPAYTRHIARFLLADLEARTAA